MRTATATLGPLAQIPAVALLAILSGCDTHHVSIVPGDCLTAGRSQVRCDQPLAAFRVFEVRRAEGSYPSCPSGQPTATFTEGGDGPMIGVTVCLEPIRAIASPAPGAS